MNKKYLLPLCCTFIISLFSMEKPTSSLEDSSSDYLITIKTSDNFIFHMPKELATQSLTPIRMQLEFNPSQDEFEFKNIDSSQFMYCYLHIMNKGNVRRDVEQMIEELDDAKQEELIDACKFLEYWPLLAELNAITVYKEQGYSPQVLERFIPGKVYVSELKNDALENVSGIRGPVKPEIFNQLPLCTGLTVLLFENSMCHHKFTTDELSQLSLCTNLKVLSLNCSNLQKFPSEVLSLINLKELRINGNNLSEIPSQISSLTELRILTANHNKLTSLPRTFSLLTNLRFLDLVHNKFTKFPLQISFLTKLENLNMNNNKGLIVFPSSISSLTNLKSLSLSINFIDPSIPVTVGLLTKLRSLHLYHNDFINSDLSESSITILKKIFLVGNRLKRSVSSLTNLRYLSFGVTYFDENNRWTSMESSTIKNLRI